MSWALRVFYKKIYAHNLKNVRAGQPVLLAVNHPTAFADPILLCIFLDPPVYNMTRGDIFQKPFFKKLLHSINMFPVFRHRDGYDNRDRNEEVFDYCSSKLQEGKTVAIYVEGEHHLTKKVLPVKKGIAYIAFHSMDKYPIENLQIVPIGCNYAFGDCARDEVMINVGTPMDVLPYYQQYRSQSAQAINQLCQDIEKELKLLCYHLDDLSDEPLADRLLELQRNSTPAAALPIVAYHQRRFVQEKAVLDKLNQLEKTEKENLARSVETYFWQPQALGLDDRALVQATRFPWLSAIMLLLFGFIPFLLGYISIWPIRTLANSVARNKVKKKEFRSSVLLGVGYLAAIPYYGIMILVALAPFQPIWLAIALFLPLLAWFRCFI